MIVFVGYSHSDVALKRCGDSAFLFISIAEPLLLCKDSKAGAPSHWYSRGTNILSACVPMDLPPKRNEHAYTFFKCHVFLYTCIQVTYQIIGAFYT